MRLAIEDKDFTTESQDFINAIYELSPVAGVLHIVLDDGNLSNKDIEWCMDKNNEETENYVEKIIYHRCCELLLQIPEKIREEYMNSYFCN